MSSGTTTPARKGERRGRLCSRSGAAVEAAGAADSAVIVELGPGVGGITRALLGAMGPEARLLSIEINPNFHSWVERINDQRLIAHLGSAVDLEEILAGYALAPPSAVVSTGFKAPALRSSSNTDTSWLSALDT